MQAQKEAPPDMQCKDKFLLQSIVASPDATPKDITAEMFVKAEGRVVEECKLRVIYVSPPQPPSPVAEGSEEGASPKASLLDNGNSNASEVTRAFVEANDKSSEERQNAFLTFDSAQTHWNVGISCFFTNRRNKNCTFVNFFFLRGTYKLYFVTMGDSETVVAQTSAVMGYTSAGYSSTDYGNTNSDSVPDAGAVADVASGELAASAAATTAGELPATAASVEDAASTIPTKCSNAPPV